MEHHSHDPELYEHITDIGQCLELLGRLDEVVWLLTQAYQEGHRLDEQQIHLLTMATYAQPVDALKYYEYCYLPSLHSNRYARWYAQWIQNQADMSEELSRNTVC